MGLSFIQYRYWRFGRVARLDFCLSSEWATPHAESDMAASAASLAVEEVGG
jgi:hypothetical protein